MGLFGLFKSKPADPRDWTQLWRLLAYLRPSPDRADLSTWRRQAAELSERDLRAAADHLAQACGMVNTEDVARYLRFPFAGAGRPFEYRRFLRVVDAVVLAGPDAVSRVAADPSAVRGYDTVPSLDPTAFYDEQRPDTGPLLSLFTNALLAHPGVWAVHFPPHGPDASWPSLTGGTPQLLRADPSVPWLDFEADLDDDNPDGPGSWENSAYQAAKSLFAALGPDPRAVTPTASAVIVEFTWDDGEPAEPAIDAESAQFVVKLTEPEAAVADPRGRVDLMTRRGAAAMLGLDLTPAGRAALEGWAS